MSTAKLSGWGLSATTKMDVYTPSEASELGAGSLPKAGVIARGLGRNYGDAAQRTGGAAVVTTNCVLAEWIDAERGIVAVDAGVSIGQLIDRFAPKGWFVPVTPGTRQVTIGGAIAADIHGKNHHRDGTFGQHVHSLRLRLASDEIIEASPTVNADIFWATVGGMGLTGVIVDATIALAKIASTSVRVETQRLDNLGQLITEMRRSDEAHNFSVAWVDLIGNARSVLTQGSFAAPAELDSDASGAHRRPSSLAIRLPPVPAPRMVRAPLMRVFNELFWRRGPAEMTVTNESITSFFHPLDAIADWNRLYGPRGFVQWQCAIPDDDALLASLCDRFKTLPAYFSVLKRFGSANQAPLSFPIAGWTLAVDLPVTDAVLTELPALDQTVADAGGRIYLAKDSRLNRRLFEQMYPRLDEWKRVRRQVDPGRRWASDLGERLGL